MEIIPSPQNDFLEGKLHSFNLGRFSFQSAFSLKLEIFYNLNPVHVFEIKSSKQKAFYWKKMACNLRFNGSNYKILMHKNHVSD